MTEIQAALAAGLQAMTAWEATAVLLAIIYLLLAIRQNVLCWPAALISASIYLVLMFQSRLYMQSALQLFYMGMALYGWWHWQTGADGASMAVKSWSRTDHILPLVSIVVPGLIVGALLARYTDAAFPFLDALAACGAIVTTWMVARKVLQNWHYWFVIDAVSVYLYASQGLWLTALLFVVYLVLILVGYRAWRASMPAHASR
ncbi:MAG: nicotinamide riboside transporter PnuC [Pseudomonadota bacterium]